MQQQVGSRCASHAAASCSGRSVWPPPRAPRRIAFTAAAHASSDAHSLLETGQQSPMEELGAGSGVEPAFPYQRFPCSSPCAPGDVRCQQVEALCQNVLNYPRIPTRLCQWLPGIPTDMPTITRVVEGLAHRYGQELTLLFLRKAPHLLNYDLDALIRRAEHVRVMLDLKPPDLAMVLRKNPLLFCHDVALARARFQALHKVMPLSNEGVKQLARKYPLVLNFRTETLEEIMDGLRQVCYSRVQWQDDYEHITSSQIAYFLRDSADIMNRLEYLAVSGRTPFERLRDVMKMTSNVFNRKHTGFRAWLQQREMLAQRQLAMLRRRQEQRAAREAALAGLQPTSGRQRGSGAAGPEQVRGSASGGRGMGR